jgi:4-hydroxy-4-methyl-2-oxoglutarate aldolase
MWQALSVSLVERLMEIDVSALSDADKSLPVVASAVRAMVPDVRMAGPAFTVVAEDDHLPVMTALAEAAPGDVLVIAANGGSRAVFGELFATEARRRGLAGSPTVSAATCAACVASACRCSRGARRRGRARLSHGPRPAGRSCAAASRSPPATSCSVTTTAC